MATILDHTLTGVKVYRNRAELTVVATAELAAGTHTLAFEGLSPHLDEKSFRLKAFGKGLVLGVQHRQYYRNLDHPYLQNPQQLRDQIKEQEEEISRLADETEVLQEEKRTLLDNHILPPTEKGNHVSELKALAEFLRVRLADISVRLREARLLSEAAELQLEKLELELENSARPSSILLHAAELQFEAAEEGEFEFELKYVCSGASWQPRYDIRVASTAEPLEIYFQALVTNRTEVDWLQVPLALSTANPAQYGALPQLQPWHIDKYVAMDYEMDMPLGGMAKSMASMAAPMGPMKKKDKARERAEEVAETAADYTVVAEGTLAVEYQIDVAYDVPSGGKPTNVDVQVLRPTTEYEHFAIPKLEQTVFLQATVKDWQSLNLLPGKANVFLEGDFVGETELRFDPEEADLKIGLGRDPKVLVKYTPKRDHTGKTFFGGTTKRLFAFEITLRNTKAQPVKLSVEDHVPISDNQEIKVELTQAGTATVVPDSNKLTWQLALQPAEAKTLQFAFEVRYPKGVELDWGRYQL